MPIQTAPLFNDPYSSTDIPSNAEDVRGATWDQAVHDLPTASMIRALDLNIARTRGNLRGKPTYDASSAEEWMAGQGLAKQFKFEDRPYNIYELSLLAERKHAELQREDILSRADGSGSSGAGRMAINLAASFLDPIAIGANFVPVVGEARYAALLAKAGGAFGRAGVRAAVGIAEGATGAALLEPIIAGTKIQEQADYHFSDSFMNIALGGLFGGGLHVAGGALGDLVRARPHEAPVSSLIDSLSAREQLPMMSDADIALSGRMTQAREELQSVHGDITRQANDILDREVSTLNAVPDPGAGPGWAKLESQLTEQRQGVDSYATRIASDYEPSAVRAEIDRLTNDPEYAASLRGKYRQRNIFDRIARQAKENVVSRRTVLETKLAERRAELAQTQAAVDAHRSKNAADQRLDYIRVFRQTDDVRKLLDALPQEAQGKLRARLESSTKEAADLLASPEAKALIDRNPPASWTVANASPAAREAALRSYVAQAVSGEPLEGRPIFDHSSLAESARRLADPDQRPLSDPVAVSRADDVLAAGEGADDPVIQQQVEATNNRMRAALDEAKLGSGDDDGEAVLARLTGQVEGELEDAKSATAQADELSKAAQLMVACALRGAA